MVPRSDNGTINTRFRSDNDSISSLTPGQALIEILREHENIIHDVRKDQIDVNNWGSDPALGIVTVENPVRQSVLLTDIIATWKTFTSESISSVGSVVTPAAAQIITSLTPGLLGLWNVEWTVEIDTAAATVPDNFKIVSPLGTVIATSENPVATGIYPQQNAQVNITSPSQAISVAAIAADATGTYKATLIATPAEPFVGTATLTFGGRTIPLQYDVGQFLATSLHGLQWEYNGAAGNQMVLTITPAAAAYLEFAGSADYRKLERL